MSRLVAEPAQPFSPELTDELVARLPELLDTVQQQLAGSPDYANFLAANRNEVARLAADSIRRLVEAVERRVENRSGQGGSPPTEGRPQKRPTEEGQGRAEGLRPSEGLRPAEGLRQDHGSRQDQGSRQDDGRPGGQVWGEEAGEGQAELPAVQAELFEVIGRIQCREGQELARLLSAYQIGAHAAWRYVSSAALRLQLSLVVVTELAEALFSFVDALTAASARGYVKEQSESAAERERLREELAAKMLSDRCDSTVIAVASDRAGWTLPALASLILIDPEDDVSLLILSRLGSITLATRLGDWMVVIWPDRPQYASRQAKIAMLRGLRAVVSRSMPLERLPASVRVMSAAARLRQQGLLDEDAAGGLLFVEDHLDAVIVHRDPRPLQALRDQVLAPLQAVPASSRERLVETLASWLRQMGDRRAMAAELHIHPQTVRYRLGQLRELFGDALDDPRTRTRFTIALLSGAGPTLSGEDASVDSLSGIPPKAANG